MKIVHKIGQFHAKMNASIAPRCLICIKTQPRLHQSHLYTKKAGLFESQEIKLKKKKPQGFLPNENYTATKLALLLSCHQHEIRGPRYGGICVEKAIGNRFKA